MSNSKTRTRPFSSTVVSLVLVAAVTLIAGQAMCVVEAGAQSEYSESAPSIGPRASSDTANRAIYGQRYIGLYDGDSFVGDHAVTREQLLVIIDRVLRDIEDGQILVESSDVELLRKLVLEFQDQLVGLNHLYQVLDAEMQDRHKRDVVLTEQTLQIKEEANDLMAKLTGFAEDLKQFVLDQAALNSEELDAAAKDSRRLDRQITEVVEAVERLQDDLREAVVDLGREISSLKFEQGVLTSRFSTLRTDTVNTCDALVSRIDSLEELLESASDERRSAEEIIAAQEQRIRQLERQLVVAQTQYEEDLKSMNDRILSLSARLSALESGRLSSTPAQSSDAESGSLPESPGE